MTQPGSDSPAPRPTPASGVGRGSRIDLLCTVVDNYGDAGVVLRLARGLKKLQPDLRLRILTDQPRVFETLGSPRLLSPVPLLALDKDPGEAPAQFLIQAFDCPLPDWLRTALAEGGKRHLLLNLEYLSAEDWVEETHLLPSLSGISGVDRIFFMPGFTPKSGGLIFGHVPPPSRLGASDHLDQARWDFLNALETRGLPKRNGLETELWLSLFSYEYDYRDLVAALAAWQDRSRRRVRLLLAPGRGAGGMVEPWEAAGRPFALEPLPFLPQDGYDRMLDLCDLNLVRGEESLARAALCGRPFVWHAYLQQDRHQLVKVQALADRLGAWLPGNLAARLGELWRDFNDRQSDGHPGPAVDWAWLLDQLPDLEPGFESFARKLGANGDCAVALLATMARWQAGMPRY